VNNNNNKAIKTLLENQSNANCKTEQRLMEKERGNGRKARRCGSPNVVVDGVEGR